ASAGPRRLAALRARPALGVSVGEQQSHYCDTEQNKTDRAHGSSDRHTAAGRSAKERFLSRRRIPHSARSLSKIHARQSPPNEQKQASENRARQHLQTTPPAVPPRQQPPAYARGGPLLEKIAKQQYHQQNV